MHDSGKDFPCELCAQNNDDVSRIIKVITIEQALCCTDYTSDLHAVPFDVHFNSIKIRKIRIDFICNLTVGFNIQ